MAAKTLFVRNNTVADLEIDDLGLILSNAQEVDILTLAQIDDVLQSARNGDLAAAQAATDLDFITGLGGSVVSPDDVLDYWITKNWHDGLSGAAAAITGANPVVEDSDGRLLPKLTSNELTDPASIVAADIDLFALLDITSTAPVTVTLPTPTTAAQSRLLYVLHNNGSTSTLTVNSQVIGAGQQSTFVWDGDFWHASDSQAAPTLDQVYDAGSKVITADAGPIELTGYTTQSPLLITPTGTAPSASLSNGEIFMFNIGGKPTLMVYDSGRAKWLSDKVMTQMFSRDGNADNAYLRKGDQLSNNSGQRMPFNGTIIAVTISTETGGNTTKPFHLRINGSLTNSDTYTLPSSNVLTETNTNIDFSAGDYFDIFVDAAGGSVQEAVVTLWYAWRA